MDIRDILRVHARAFNGRDLETVVGQYTPRAAVFRDGEWLGEGHDAVKDALADEYGWADAFDQVVDLDGEPVLVEWSGEDSPEPRALLRFQALDGRITECRISHDPAEVRRAAEHAMEL